jgi:adenine-specific DNA-methyltransferase
MAKRATKRKVSAAASTPAAVKKSAKPVKQKKVAAISHAATASRRNIPTAEYQDAAETQEAMDPRGPVTYARARPLAQGETRPRDGDKDPQIVWKGMRITLSTDQIEKLKRDGTIEIGDAQLVWRGKDQQDWSDLVINAPPLYIQEKIHPKAIIDDLVRHSKDAREAESDAPSLFSDLFADFNGLNDPEARTEFYQHSQHWSNRMILGDSLQVMASLAEREALRGKVQCIYFDPPYGIKFNSNWQVSTQSRDVKDGKQTDISREPEQVKAFRDTWVDGIHSYLTYLRDRLTVARDLLTESGSIFVQIGDENVHRVRALMDEVFGAENSISQIIFLKTAGATSEFLPGTYDAILFYARNRTALKFRPPHKTKALLGDGGSAYTRLRDERMASRPLERSELLGESPLPSGHRVYRIDNLTSQSVGRQKGEGAASWFPVDLDGKEFRPSIKARWKTNEEGMARLKLASRLQATESGLYYVRYFDDFPVFPDGDVWSDTGIAGFNNDKRYVVETSTKVVQRCLLMTTDPGDLVLDPTCGSGTTAVVAEQWGRRWITIDTSRVALALARTRLMSARFPYYNLADSKEGRAKEQDVSGRIQPDVPTTGDIRQGFVYERAPHITLKSIANNAEIDVIWEAAQKTLEPLRVDLNKALKKTWEEWEILREADPAWPDATKKLHAAWWEARIERQRNIDASIVKAADIEYLYDRPYADTSKVRVTGPFTVESLSPHRVVPSGHDEMADELKAMAGKRRRARLATPPADFTAMIIEHLRSTGVQQVQQGGKLYRITFDSIAGRATRKGEYIGAEAIYLEGTEQRRAAILIGPEFGSLSKADLLAAAAEAQKDRFDMLVACAFSFDAHASEIARLGPMPVLKAKMNPDLHMAGELKNTGKGNLFVVFGEPDIDIQEHDNDHLAVKINGVDVFDPNTGDIRSGDTKSIAAWFIDTDYNEESFFVRHAYFLGANDPYKSLKAALKAEIDKEAWEALYSDTSRPFPRPKTGKIAVKVINHFGDEVMKVFRV